MLLRHFPCVDAPFLCPAGLPVLRRAWAIRGFEARSVKGHTPPFPTPSTVEVVQGVAGA